MRTRTLTVSHGGVPRKIARGMCLLAPVLLAGCAPLGQSELHRQASSVAAVSSEGALLAHEVALDRTRDTFVRVHADELSAQMDHTVQKLRETEQENEVPTDLRRPTDRIVRLANDAADALQELEFNPADAGLAQGLEQRLQETSAAATRVGSEL
jgi:hypothetical protein